MRNDNPRQQIARLRRRSSNELYLFLARRTRNAVAYRRDHWVREIHGGVERSKTRHDTLAFRSVDVPTLETLADALHGRASKQEGEAILRRVWKGIQKEVCDKLDICNRFKAGDIGLILAIWQMLHRGQPVTDNDAYLIVAVLAVRFGPEWMCQCSKRKTGAT